MTIFEYLIIAFSLLFTITALRLVGGLPSAIVLERRYWIHIIFVITTLLGVIFIFWNYWSLQNIIWTLPKFILALIVPGLYYFVAVLLVPDNQNEIKSWREYYYSIRVKFFSALAIWLTMASVSITMLLEVPLWHPIRIVHLVSIIFCIIGALVSTPKIHWVLAIFFLIQILVMIMLVGSRPGWMTEA